MEESQPKQANGSLPVLVFYSSAFVGGFLLAALSNPKYFPYPLIALLPSILSGLVVLSVFAIGIKEIHLQRKTERENGILFGKRTIAFWSVIGSFISLLISPLLFLFLGKFAIACVAIFFVTLLWAFVVGLGKIYLQFRIARETGFGLGKAAFFWWIVLTSLIATVLSSPSRTSNYNKQNAESSSHSLERIQGESDSSFAIRLIPIGIRNQVEATIAKKDDVIKTDEWHTEPIASGLFVVTKTYLSSSGLRGWYFEVDVKNKTFKAVNGDSTLEKKYGLR